MQTIGSRAQVSRRVYPPLLAALLLATGPVSASRVTYEGGKYNRAYGKSVTVLPSGNFVITDPNYHPPAGGADSGLVVLIQRDIGVIATLVGSAGDRIGSGGVVVLADGDFVVSSPAWNGGRGAVTWGSGSTGFPRGSEVNEQTSLVGSNAGDEVGKNNFTEANPVTALPNGAYVVESPNWGEGKGAVSWSDGRGLTVGPVSAQNSLVGPGTDAAVGSGGVTLLANGNYVVSSPLWEHSTSAEDVGAATWCPAIQGCVGEVSSSNSLVGSTQSDAHGMSVTALANGHYVVLWPNWYTDGGGPFERPLAFAGVGAASWGNGLAGSVGHVSSANALIGTTGQDLFDAHVLPLSNGNFVLVSPHWTDPDSDEQRGAATWVNGAHLTAGEVSPDNSLVGDSDGDGPGMHAVALSNGHYAVAFPRWDAVDGGRVEDVGAVVWGHGLTGTRGTASNANPFVGGTEDDGDALSVVALTNGHYVIGMPSWDHGAIQNAGAVIWRHGSSAPTQRESPGPSNALKGSKQYDRVGYAITPLSNGHYVVSSPYWDGEEEDDVGAVTWVDGRQTTASDVQPSNSLIGSRRDDRVGAVRAVADGTTMNGVFALTNGHYVVVSSDWLLGSGAVTWRDGRSASPARVSHANSLFGGSAHDLLRATVHPLADGDYVLYAPMFDEVHVALPNAGAIVLGRGKGGSAGFMIEDYEGAVVGLRANSGDQLSWSYDAGFLAVGEPARNVVTLLQREQLFADGFDARPAGGAHMLP